MHREVRALPLWVELLDLVIAGDSWSPDLNDVHVVTRHVDLTEASHELSDQALLSPPIMKARVILSEVVGAGGFPGVDQPPVALTCVSLLRWREKQTVQGPGGQAMLVESRDLQMDGGGGGVCVCVYIRIL